MDPVAERREILLIEDHPGDARLVVESFKKADHLLHLNVVEDGEGALAFLRREGKYAGSPRPDLILLDMDLVGRNGPEVLAQIKADAKSRRIPVIALGTSDQDMEITRSYDLQANCYITKPLLFEDFLGMIRAIERFWLGVVRLPER